MLKLICAMIGDRCGEELNLSFKSVINEVDKLIFVWGMEDVKTKEMVLKWKEKYPDKVVLIERKFDKEYKGENGRARNTYLKYVQEHFPNSYLLVLDPDEVVDDILLLKKRLNEVVKDKILDEKKYHIFHIKMRHLIYNFGHEDFTRPVHFVLGRLFKIKDQLIYPEREHPIIEIKEEGINDKVYVEYLQTPVIWHLGYAKSMFEIYRKWKNHLKKSQIHTAEFLRWWYLSHLFGEYPVKKIHPLELPKIIRDYFELDVDDELYFRNRMLLEEKHWRDCYYWKVFFKPKNCLIVGCGMAQRVFTMNALGVDCKGFDISKFAITYTPYKTIKSKLFVDDIVNLQHRGKYDLVVCYDVLEHIEENNVDKALKNIYNLTNKYALFGITFKDNPNFDLDPTHKTGKSRDWWIDKIKGSGFKIIETPNHFLFKEQIIIGKKE